ncbi:MAG: PEP-CTERM sorting domain-containing protein, partial [Acidobacteriota bacterium]|nr:PEP-CTERM sorting domain-containing protein [Acidobacteriota bacterium]
AVCFLGLSNIASANPIGTMNLANCGGGGVTVTATQIIWSPAGTAPDTGCIITGLGTNITWAGPTIGAGVTGNIMDLTAGILPVDHFIDLPAPPTSPSLDFVLTGIGPGSSNTNCAAATAPGSTCSVFAGSPFILTFDGVGTTTVGLSTRGTVTDSIGTTNWLGGFSTQFNLTPAQIQGLFATAGQISSTYSAQFTLTAVPEPVTTGLIGSGLIALAFIRRRKNRA